MTKSKPPAIKDSADATFGLPPEAFKEPQNIFGKTIAMSAITMRNTLQTLLDSETNETKRVALQQLIIQAEGMAEMSVGLDRMARLAKKTIDEKMLDAETEKALTGLPNKLGFQRHINEQVALATDDKPLSILALDIDHFKAVNDTFGHPVGDIVLKDVADLLRANMRSQDVASRWGGEEFFVILPNVSEDGAKDVAERIRKAVEARKGEGIQAPVTISIGVAQYRTGEGVDAFVKRADDALYTAKVKGRNRVALAQAVAPIAIKPVAGGKPVL